ncbi:MAG: hypothetical protein HWQ38_24190 [Nostoc sp. NMS7]|uniref:hypothetical protein n=1 Tax=Nostoc sp. NMS7 TaxID=2815391 RepID=UPI0025EBB3DC|nr:hypothetical protein [Nostoc sp. NMS7]MBN3949394.1 hypothetical protein [Nostoc sp. NMS7]
MDRERLLTIASEVKDFSSRGIELIRLGKYVEGHSLMRQAVDAGRRSRGLIKQGQIQQTLQALEKTHPG